MNKPIRFSCSSERYAWLRAGYPEYAHLQLFADDPRTVNGKGWFYNIRLPGLLSLLQRSRVK